MDKLEIYSVFITIIMGLGWGSFATMATYRLPRNMTWIGDKPRCFMCKHELNIIDYFSIISYFIWKGKCRYCKGEYETSLSYFFTETLITALFLACYFIFGFGDMFVILTGFSVAAVILGTIDAEHKKIPSKVLISTLLIAIIYRMFLDKTFYGALYGGIGGLICGLAIRYVYFTIKGQKEIAIDYTKWQHDDRFKGPGFDYVKLLGIVGVFLPFLNFFYFIAISGLIILLWNLIHKRSLRIGTILISILTGFLFLSSSFGI